jgi:hypothetical protein
MHERQEMREMREMREGWWRFAAHQTLRQFLAKPRIKPWA